MKKMEKFYVNASLGSLLVTLISIVVQIVLPMHIVLLIRHASMSDVLTPVLGHVEQTLNVEFLIMFPYVHVLKDILVLHIGDVIPFLVCMT